MICEGVIFSTGCGVALRWLTIAAFALVVPGYEAHAGRSDSVAIARPWSPLLLEVQTALAHLGFYNGSIDGQFTIETGHAVRRYREMHKLQGNGQDWPRLIEHLNVQVEQTRTVKSDLDRARISQIAAARSLLDEGVQIQQLLHVGPDSGTVALETDGCLVVPTADCLFALASESVGRVEREEYRNWALRDLIREQAMSGRVEAAFDGLKKLSDPRLIFVSLREIAEGVIRNGDLEKALETARLIPEPNQRVKALTAVTETLLKESQYLQARSLGREVSQLLMRQRNIAERILMLVSLAEKFVSAGDKAYGRELLDSAGASLAGLVDGPARDAVWATIAKVRFALGDSDAAKDALTRIEGSKSHLWAIAAASAHHEIPKHTLRFAVSIDDIRYRTLALGEVAESRHRMGDTRGAKELFERAERLVAEIDSPYAGSFALARIAGSYAELGLFHAAARTAREIKDEDLKARSLWAVSSQLRESGRLEEAGTVEAQAMKVASHAQSAFDRVALFGGFGISLAQSNRPEAARRTFEEALRESRKIKTDWWRVRALARLARVLHEIEMGNRKTASRRPIIE